MQRFVFHLAMLTMLAGSLALVGCQENGAEQQAGQSSMAKRAEQAKADPFGYHPDFSDMDVNGGNATTFDKEGMKRDLNDVFNP